MAASRKRLRPPTALTKSLHAELAAVAEVMPGWSLEVCQSSKGYYVAARYQRGSDDAELQAARLEPRVFGHSPSVPALKHWLTAFAVGVKVGRWINRAR